MIITRFAPSPTGLLHVGSVRTLLFNYLFTKKMGGKMLLRIEDTDKERSKKEHEAYIYESMKWLGITPDDIFVQSARTDIYVSYIERLLAEDKAYISKETNESGVERELVRLRNPGKVITFTDIIRGDITFDTTELGDFIIARTIREPLYHFVVVVDDFEMNVTHVIRGEDHISNTPRQILIQEAIGAVRPHYAHLPLILAEDKSKLSKRKHGEMVATLTYRDRGYSPEAFLNFLALLGWNAGNDTEIYTRDELIAAFSLEKIHKNGAIFDTRKLKHVNRAHLMRMEPDVFDLSLHSWIEKGSKCRNMTIRSDQYPILSAVLKERISVFGDVVLAFEQGDFDFIFTDEQSPYMHVKKEQLIWKKSTLEKTLEHISYILITLPTISDDAWTKDSVKEALWPYAETNGKGDVLWPLRYILSGKEQSPDPFILSAILGKYETIKRVSYAQKLLRSE